MIKRAPVVRAVLAFGSNLGDREATIHAALDELRATPGVRVVAASPLIESIAVRPEGESTEHPAYLNGVAIVETSLEPEALLDVAQRIENDFGRVRAEHWGDRTLDIDIVDFDGREIDTPRLVTPHPWAGQRLFVLEPWLAIDAHAEIPGVGSVADRVTALRGDQS